VLPANLSQRPYSRNRMPPSYLEKESATHILPLATSGQSSYSLPFSGDILVLLRGRLFGLLPRRLHLQEIRHCFFRQEARILPRRKEKESPSEQQNT
jgi:hypothetical protein